MVHGFRKLLKVLGVIFGIAAVLLIALVVMLFYSTDQQINRVYDIPVQTIPIPENSHAIARGKHLIENIALCSECHGENLSGQVINDGPLMGVLRIANLTPGKGGIPRDYQDEDWIRAIRHGIAPNGKSLIGMWSNYYYYFSDADLGAIIAYLKTLPPIDNEMEPTRLGPMARLLVVQDPTILPARVIDHTAPHPQAPEVGATVEYGRYLGHFCTMCHGSDLSGGDEAGNGVNITPAGSVGKWSYEQFAQTIRTGVNPDGKELDSVLMPWKKLSNLSDTEMRAIYLYLQTVPPVVTEATPLPESR